MTGAYYYYPIIDTIVGTLGTIIRITVRLGASIVTRRTINSIS